MANQSRWICSCTNARYNSCCIGECKVEADSELAFTPSVEYFFNDNISAELLLATPISHDVLINGAEAVKIKHLPPTLTAKYNFKNSTGFTPYIGVGATAFIAWDEEGVKSVKEDFGYAAQIGFNFQPADAKTGVCLPMSVMQI